ncbi:MAG: bifunctional (p)ppGpp synthetase/guanosine-3',5'-bis(diphosphate) 3'-pyrophosphohydrolase [Corallococcus sp.]|nr:bifunctional (p)ppGpp synthetase/guanosine-3',5'-bis(diphosphate) 3'-pyrophosphohydrolase [Corallococcus sp.]MCM1359444.1 bifunctional (p)ppGpp synthetase/guanosine-3',5'-bis(diphosphate) 3'-pyrophosphohydrolase [Corallococcus sp.]MCM1394744.1 bifunctional (p)ppGpp synthetase/guanosine-3',5'-bis(diphosphate) 3'-pyrophosphohydrolase [Corallococcus sp.]
MYSEKESAEVTVNNFLSKIKHYYHASDENRISEAFTVAQKAHEGQFRASGRPYITHPTIVADILVDMGFDVPTVCAALLHDTVEDTYITDADLRKKFGNEIADLVAGVTKLDRIQFHNKEEEQAENMRKMFFAMAKDVRVMMIKLADRLHNMRSLMYLSEEKQQVIAKETLDIFAPIAGRLGISPVKSELEDLCLKYLDRPAYDAISEGIAMKKNERESIVDVFIEHLKEELRVAKIEDFDIYGRTKHFYSIYKKMKKQNKTLEQVYDLTAVRVIVDTIKDCYAVLGSIHARWKPMPGRFKDYIAVPKPNMYQSLHTTVFVDFDGHSYPIEVQIRTHEMHKIAEYGIAAHWKYKEGVIAKTGMDENLGWVKEVLSYDKDFKDSTEFLNLIRKDISNTAEVYVFTPNGDVKMLPAGANALDFAYAVHSQVGNKCVGTKVNNKIVPLDTVLQTGDTVEVMTNPNAKGPSRDWLKIVTTPSAKAKIRQFFKRELKDEYIRTGKSMVERDARHRGISPSDLLTSDAIDAVCERYMFSNVDEMYAAVGYGSISLTQVMLKLISANNAVSEAIKVRQGSRRSKVSANKEKSVIIKGVEDLLVRFSRCCSPVPGDEIVGYISRGRGVCVHRTDCPAVKNMEPERLVRAEWANTDGNTAFPATIEIISEDKGDIFAEITKAIVNESLPIVAINARKDKKGNAVATITVEISNHDQVNQLMNKLKTIPAVINVYRTNK